MGTAEVESALVAHAKVAEAAVVGFPHDIKGQGIYAYVTLNAGEEPSDDLRSELVTWVRTEIGPIAPPDTIQFSPGLHKTRSGTTDRKRVVHGTSVSVRVEQGDSSIIKQYKKQHNTHYNYANPEQSTKNNTTSTL